MSQNLLSAAVEMCALRVKMHRTIDRLERRQKLQMYEPQALWSLFSVSHVAGD